MEDPFENRERDRALNEQIFADIQDLCPSAQQWKLLVEPITRGKLHAPDPRNRAAAELEQLSTMEGSLVVKYRIRWVYEYLDGPFLLDARSLWTVEANYPTVLSVLKLSCSSSCVVISYEMLSEHARGLTPTYAKDEPRPKASSRAKAGNKPGFLARATRFFGDALIAATQGLTQEQLEEVQKSMKGLSAEQLERLQKEMKEEEERGVTGDPPAPDKMRRRDGSSKMDEPTKELAAEDIDTARPAKMPKLDEERNEPVP